MAKGSFLSEEAWLDIFLGIFPAVSLNTFLLGLAFTAILLTNAECFLLLEDIPLIEEEAAH
jgi:hypothetical protein